MKRFIPWLLLSVVLVAIGALPGLAQGNRTYLPLAVLPIPTATNTVAPTATQVPPTATGVPPTATEAPPTATEIPTQQPTPTGANVVCASSGTTELCAWVSNGTPAQNSDVTVYGRLYINGNAVAGQQMTTVWHYRSSTPTCDTGFTDATGVATCTRSIGRATLGAQVDIDVTLGGLSVVTFFTPQ